MIPLYNRYIPQPDGTYKRKRVQSPQPPQEAPTIIQPPPAPPHEQPCPPTMPPETAKDQAPIPVKPKPLPPPPPKRRPAQQGQEGVFQFFRQLLPQNLDTGDLLIILLLLLMAGDNEETRNNALLTLALYFFM